eukprot:CAMPEP_0183296496 /NCGR_PEP_ID=MMETSP0160_2-20130417/4025_1 /TAXON_ID=2839 ORGANISM="Odontella Sinensis, Strain Grunow 1884" /NCGR_SAMPLE_ID=MMETSP0160_2 /ASSEMBLY_ACC=CAM_ASM_000250 /LENGTH=74 /DNA_ID=CAMNT_0025458115 /DNA_START=57 /DNA_END=281 /DNA_ORIENTATION=+
MALSTELRARENASVPIQNASSDQTNDAQANGSSVRSEAMVANIMSGLLKLSKPRKKEKHFLCEEFVNEILHDL